MGPGPLTAGTTGTAGTAESSAEPPALHRLSIHRQVLGQSGGTAGTVWGCRHRLRCTFRREISPTTPSQGTHPAPPAPPACVSHIAAPGGGAGLGSTDNRRGVAGTHTQSVCTMFAQLCAPWGCGFTAAGYEDGGDVKDRHTDLQHRGTDTGPGDTAPSPGRRSAGGGPGEPPWLTALGRLAQGRPRLPAWCFAAGGLRGQRGTQVEPQPQTGTITGGHLAPWPCRPTTEQPPWSHRPHCRDGEAAGAALLPNRPSARPAVGTWERDCPHPAPTHQHAPAWSRTQAHRATHRHTTPQPSTLRGSS